MKKLVFTLVLSLIAVNMFSQVAINSDGSSPDASAILDIQSNAKGLLIPRMDTPHRTAIASPAQGLMVYDTDDSTFYFYKNNSWIKVGEGTEGWYLSGNYVYTPYDSVGIGTSTPMARLEVHGRISQTGTGKSVFLGEGAGKEDDISNNYNVFVGYYAGYYNISGEGNVINGYDAFYRNRTGNYNVAYGYKSLNKNISGYYNVAIGAHSLFSNVSGYDNVANGYMAMYKNTNGYDNIASGYCALYENTSGYYNIAFGKRALYLNTLGHDNIGLGYNALRSNTTGIYNMALGSEALYYNTQGEYNIAIGQKCLFNNNTGNNNIAIGMKALDSTDASNNIAIGYQAGYSNKTGSGNIFIGYQAGYFETRSNRLYIDNTSTLTPLIGGNFSTDEVVINGTLKITGGNPGEGKILKSDASGNASWVDGNTLNGGGWTVNGNYIYNIGDSVGIGTSSPHEPFEIADSDRGSGRMIISDGGDDNRQALLFVSPDTTEHYSRIDSYTYETETGLPLHLNTFGGGDVVMGGDCLPIDDTVQNLGSSSKVWKNIYYHNLVNSGAAAFTDRNVTVELLKNPPKPKPAGAYHEFTESGLKELDPESLPKELQKGYAILTDEMVTYNYKANYEQQVQLETLKNKLSEQNRIIENQSNTISELIKKVEQLEQIINNQK